jgi:hypothetical protein
MSFDTTPQRLTSALATAVEEAEQVAGSTGPEKKAFAVEAMRAIAGRTLNVEDTILVGALAGPLVDLIVAASKGLLHVNEKEEPSPRCFGKSCALS